MAALAEPVVTTRWVWLAAALAGTLPLFLGWLLGSALHQPIAALLLFFGMIAACRASDPVRGMGIVATGFGAHCAAAITLAYIDPVRAAACMTDGPGYLEAQLVWITTGLEPEYDPSTWLPHHAQLLVGMVVLSVVSLGWIPLIQGMYEVDLMNFYVGGLLARSESPFVALFLGWHPWSVLRGLCYVVLVYEIASWSLAWASGRATSTNRARLARWGAVLTLWLADVLVKWLAMEPVRAQLAANLLESP